MTTFNGEGCKLCNHPDYAHVNGICTLRTNETEIECRCTVFVSPTVEAVAALSSDERRAIACANYLGINPKKISAIETVYNGGGHIEGIRVVIYIWTGRQVWEWVKRNLPTTRISWVTEYLEYLSKKSEKNTPVSV